MKNTHPTPLRVAVTGAIAGMGGALLLTGLVSGARALSSGQSPHHENHGITAGEALSEGPDLAPNLNRVTALFVQKIATGIFGRSLTARQQYLAGVAWHMVYGGCWGQIYALARSSAQVSDAILIPMYGLLVWAVGPGWLVPEMGLLLSPLEQNPRTLATVAGAHLAYSATTALGYHWMAATD